MFIATSHAQKPTAFAVVDNWDVPVTLPDVASRTLRVTPPAMIEVTAE